MGKHIVTVHLYLQNGLWPIKILIARMRKIHAEILEN